MVFSIFALVTLPISSVRSPRSDPVVFCVSGVACVSAVIPISSCLLQSVCAEKRIDARQIFFRFAETLQRFRLSGGQLKPQPENRFRQFFLLRGKLVYARFANFCHALGHDYSSPSRETNFVGIANLCAPKPKPSRAVASSTPAISNIIRPGFTTDTHFSGAPLPLPMRVSAGFLVNGLSGKMRIHSLPPRLMNLVMATRDASI